LLFYLARRQVMLALNKCWGSFLFSFFFSCMRWKINAPFYTADNRNIRIQRTCNINNYLLHHHSYRCNHSTSKRCLMNGRTNCSTDPELYLHSHKLLFVVFKNGIIYIRVLYIQINSFDRAWRLTFSID